MLALPDETRLSKRASLLAKVTIIAAGAVLLLGAVDGYRDAKPALNAGHAIDWKLLRRFAGTMAESSALPAATMLIAAVVLVVAVRIAASDARPAWVPEHDGLFAQRALLFARVASTFAWIYLGYACVTFVSGAVNLLSHLPNAPGSDLLAELLRLSMDRWVTGNVISVLCYFLILLAGVYLIWILVTLSVRDAGGREEIAPTDGNANEQLH
jgi:hypothetical protein